MRNPNSEPKDLDQDLVDSFTDKQILEATCWLNEQGKVTPDTFYHALTFNTNRPVGVVTRRAHRLFGERIKRALDQQSDSE